MQRTLVLAFAAIVALLSLPSESPSQRQSTRATDQEQIERMKQMRDEMIELKRELNTRRFLEAVSRQLPNADLRKIKRQYDIPSSRGLRDLPDVDIRRRIQVIRTTLPPGVLSQMSQHQFAMYYGDLDIMEIALIPPQSGTVSRFVSDEHVLGVARSVVAIVGRNSLTRRNEGGWLLHVDSLKVVDGQELCQYERWWGAPTTDVRGTGFLVADSIIATAGHVVRMDENGSYESFLDSVCFVFDYAMEDEESVKTIYADELVYKGAEVVERKLGMLSDWALIRLHRKVVGRQPLRCRTQGKAENGFRLYMIGHPDGLPQQYSRNAKVIEDSPCSYFVADLDTRSYNSGSPVINADSSAFGRPLVEGILVADKANYEELCECVVLKAYSPQSGRPGAEVTRATEFVGMLENVDSVVVQCNLHEGAGVVYLPSQNICVGIAAGREKRLPWEEYYRLWVPGLTCMLEYSPDRGSVWEIVEWRIVDAKAGTMNTMKMQKVCSP